MIWVSAAPRSIGAEGKMSAGVDERLLFICFAADNALVDVEPEHPVRWESLEFCADIHTIVQLVGENRSGDIRESGAAMKFSVQGGGFRLDV